MEIAAVKDLFLEDAWKVSTKRILDAPDPPAKMQVDTDPIITFKVLEGYLIVTAWGDESNDEHILNPINN